MDGSVRGAPDPEVAMLLDTDASNVGVGARADHSALSWLLEAKEPEGQMARWIQELETYEFEVIHKPGKRHGNAYRLSRGPCKHCGWQEEGESGKQLGVVATVTCGAGG